MLVSNLLKSLFVLGGATDVNLVMPDLDLEPGREECVEPHNEVRVTSE